MGAAEYSIAHVLRGYVNFEDVYQGEQTSTPVMLSPEPSGRDPEAQVSYDKLAAQYRANGGFGGGLTAADNGVSPFLVAGLPVPFGSMVTLLLPNLAGDNNLSPPPITYHVIWRMRSVSQFIQKRAPYHMAFDGVGQPDDGSQDVQPIGGVKFAGSSAVRKLIIASTEMIRYPQSAPASPDQWAEETMWGAGLVTQTTDPVDRPLFPGFGGQLAIGDVQQGYIMNGQGNFPVYVPYETRAMGDELLIAVTMDSGTWDFDTTNYIVSLLFGRAGYETGKPTVATPLKQNPTLGVYVLTGSGS